MTAIELLETSPRDGLQNEKTLLSTADKVELVERAITAGARRIEVTSFVNPSRVPAMADAEAVMQAVPRVDGVRYAGLVMNARGLDRAIAAGVDEIDIVVVATDTFCQRNQGMTTAESVSGAANLVSIARTAGIFATITIGAAFGCPFEGEVPIERLHEVLRGVADAGADEIALADTIGVAVPTDITQRVALAASVAPGVPLRLHLHDTRNTGVANAVAGVAAGITTFDASIGGTGGCPFAPNATGNVATEDLVYAFERMGLRTSQNLESLRATAEWLEDRLGHCLPSAILRAGGFPSSQ